MQTAIYRFLSLDARNVIPEVYWGLAFIYTVLVITTFNSIRSQDMSMSRKILWGSFALTAPIAGMATYSLRCLLTADHDFLRSIGLLRSHHPGTTNHK
jgi:hypothetical protein